MNLLKLFSENKGNKINLSTVLVSYSHEKADEHWHQPRFALQIS